MINHRFDFRLRYTGLRDRVRGRYYDKTKDWKGVRFKGYIEDEVGPGRQVTGDLCNTEDSTTMVTGVDLIRVVRKVGLSQDPNRKTFQPR